MLDPDLGQIAAAEPRRKLVRLLSVSRGISTRAARVLISEIGDFRRFVHARELANYLEVARPASGPLRPTDSDESGSPG